MGRKSKHHYVPKCYLKGFTNGGENSSSFWCIPKNNNTPFLTTPNNACVKRDYYSVAHSNSLVVEDWYGEKIEPKIGGAIRKIKDCSVLPSKDEMGNLILLLATLYLRVPSFREKLEMPLKRTKEIVESISQETNISNKHEFEYSKNDLIAAELKLIDIVQESLSKKYYQLHIIDNEEISAITSDSPFILNHPNHREGFYFGLDTPNIEICVPITKNAILLARNEKINEGTFIACDELVGLINSNTIMSANRYFYSSDENVLLADDKISLHSHNIKTKESIKHIKL